MIYLILDPQNDPSQNQIYLSVGKCLFPPLILLVRWGVGGGVGGTLSFSPKVS